MDDFLPGQACILLLDSDPARSARRRGQLSSQGRRVIDVADEREALRAVEAECVDLALLHLSPTQAAQTDLPGAIQRQSGGAYLPVVVISDQQAGEKQRCQCLDSGANDILPESISPDELWARMNALLRIKNLQDALNDSRRALQEALRREHELLTKLRDDNDRLSRQVVTDPLNRLYNLRYFERFLADEFKIARRYGHSLGLLVLDLDHFKMVNDRHGHPAGDFVLKEFSVVLRQNVRESDVVARTGGEEFAIILPRATRSQADYFAQRIRRTVADHRFLTGSTEIGITCSVGLACFGCDADVTSPQHLIYYADQALLAAKQSGRDCVVHWFEMDSAVKTRLRSQIRNVVETTERPRPEKTRP